ncbi:Retrovirus-related Pol polyprotein from transposon 17.6 [Vitis vinifera]|uniref:Retrovirus-related Pol polyprotein from transposon 17.6 n=1 Tax=Vitis vinifera TaxID=29760 RepID=A0A438IEB7_VITVI|nr:Retrovirus-related Pol polyprotein from transposon 17.6 [Vitis vinifera]
MHAQKTAFPCPNRSDVDSTSGKGCSLSWMPSPDITKSPCPRMTKKKTAFITPHDLYCYKVMPFRLKNAGATYQKLMTKIFKPLIGHSVEVYIDDIVVKSKLENSISFITRSFSPLAKVWHETKSFQMRLWRECRQISRFMVSPKGHRSSPDQVKTVMETPPPRNKKELHASPANRCVRAFHSPLHDELRPFFLAIRKAGSTGWTGNCQNALERINIVLCNPRSQRRNYTCIWQCQNGQFNAVLFRCPSPRSRNPSTTSAGHCRRGNQIFKNGANNLSPSKRCPKSPALFSSPPGDRVNRSTSSQILHKPDLTGRMLQWAIELSEFGIEFQPRLSMKGQVMADFVLEYSRRPSQHTNQVNKNGGLCELTEPHDLRLRNWAPTTIPNREHLEQAIRLGFSCL